MLPNRLFSKHSAPAPEIQVRALSQQSDCPPPSLKLRSSAIARNPTQLSHLSTTPFHNNINNFYFIHLKLHSSLDFHFGLLTISLKRDKMSTRKRKQDEELVALPSDESEEEEEYVFPSFQCASHRKPSMVAQLASLELLHSSIPSCPRGISSQGCIRRKTPAFKSKLRRR